VFFESDTIQRYQFSQFDNKATKHKWDEEEKGREDYLGASPVLYIKANHQSILNEDQTPRR